MLEEVSGLTNHGQTVNSRPLDRFVVFAAGGSRYQPWAQTMSPAEKGLPSAFGLLAMKAFQSRVKAPSHRPLVPPELDVPHCPGES